MLKIEAMLKMLKLEKPKLEHCREMLKMFKMLEFQGTSGGATQASIVPGHVQVLVFPTLTSLTFSHASSIFNQKGL